MNDNVNVSRRADRGALVLRVALGVVLLAHSVYLKGVVYTLPGTAQVFESIGLPGPLAHTVFTVELIGGVLLIIGSGMYSLDALREARRRKAPKVSVFEGVWM